MPDPHATQDRVAVWVQDRDWDIPENVKLLGCRMCGKPAAAVLYRRYGDGLPRRWAYCKRHMYGREIIRGVVHHQVLAGSQAAQDGYTMILNQRFHA